MDWEPRVGMRVVCVDASKSPNLFHGRIYTIREIRLATNPAPLFGELSPCGLRFAEATPMPGFAWFAARRFMPLRERKTDISIFTALLTQAPTKKELA